MFVHQGYGSSPAVYKSLVIVSADTKIGGAICGLNRADGKEIWRVERPEVPELSITDHSQRRGKRSVVYVWLRIGVQLRSR